jgi:phosphate:Na+ symporter
MFHTAFNIVMMLIFMWLTEYIEKIDTWMVKDDDKSQGNVFKLKYIGNGRLGTPALSIRQAYQEILDFEHAAEEGFRDVGCALAAEDDDTFEEYRKSLIKTEEVTDRYEYEIASFLSDISSEQMTGQETEETRVLYRVIGELESLGDSCENISRLLSRLRAHKQEFDSGTMEKLKEMIGLVENAMATMGINLKSASAGSLTDITNAYEAEDAINSARDTFRDEAFVQIEQQEGNYLSLNYFLDFIEELEAMGDFIINVSQAVVRTEE